VAETKGLCLPVRVSRESLERLTIMVELLKKWQSRINLVGPGTIDDIWRRHICDSLQLIPLLPPGTLTVADLGSGAGFPGLVLALAAPVHVHLFESNTKKASFLAEVIRSTGCKATVHTRRLEVSETETFLPRVNLVTSRALAPLPLLLSYAKPFLGPGVSALFLKGQDVDAELTAATKSWRILLTIHRSMTDSRGVILHVKEANRVALTTAIA
jgi:16S rRNA (guanine527-N7)-methyltransferase